MEQFILPAIIMLVGLFFALLGLIVQFLTKNKKIIRISRIVAIVASVVGLIEVFYISLLLSQLNR